MCLVSSCADLLFLLPLVCASSQPVATTTRGIGPLPTKLAVLSRVVAAATTIAMVVTAVVVVKRVDLDRGVLRCAAPA